MADVTMQPMETAPKGGTPILIRFEHFNYRYAKTPEEKARWEENCIAHWIDHNGGGWTWHGIAGTPTGWRPLPADASVNPLSPREGDYAGPRTMAKGERSGG